MTQFSTKATGSEDFQLEDGTVSKVQMMKLYNKKFNIQKIPGKK